MLLVFNHLALKGLFFNDKTFISWHLPKPYKHKNLISKIYANCFIWEWSNANCQYFIDRGVWLIFLHHNYYTFLFRLSYWLSQLRFLPKTVLICRPRCFSIWSSFFCWLMSSERPIEEAINQSGGDHAWQLISTPIHFLAAYHRWLLCPITALWSTATLCGSVLSYQFINYVGLSSKSWPECNPELFLGWHQFPSLVGLVWAAWIFVRDFSSTNPSGPLREGVRQHGVKGINSSYSKLHCRQPQTWARFRAGQPAKFNRPHLLPFYKFLP